MRWPARHASGAQSAAAALARPDLESGQPRAAVPSSHMPFLCVFLRICLSLSLARRCCSEAWSPGPEPCRIPQSLPARRRPPTRPATGALCHCSAPAPGERRYLCVALRPPCTPLLSQTRTAIGPSAREGVHFTGSRRGREEPPWTAQVAHCAAAARRKGRRPARRRSLASQLGARGSAWHGTALRSHRAGRRGSCSCRHLHCSRRAGLRARIGGACRSWLPWRAPVRLSGRRRAPCGPPLLALACTPRAWCGRPRRANLVLPHVCWARHRRGGGQGLGWVPTSPRGNTIPRHYCCYWPRLARLTRGTPC